MTKKTGSAVMLRGKASKLEEETKRKEPPFYQPGMAIRVSVTSTESYPEAYAEPYSIPDPEDLEGDGLNEGIVEKIEGRVLTIKLDHMRVDDNGREICPGVAGYDTAHERVRVEIPEDFTNIFILTSGIRRSYGLTREYIDAVYVKFEDIRVGQRLDIEWARKFGSQDPFKMLEVAILPY